MTKNAVVGLSIVAATAVMFAFDLYPVTNVAEGAAYVLVVALSAYFGRRAVLLAGSLGVVLAITAPFLGAEDEQTLVHLVSGRIFAVAVIVLSTVVLLHLVKLNEAVSRDRKQMALHQLALRQMALLALSADKTLLERLQIITERTAAILDVDRASVGHIDHSGQQFRFLDVWDRRIGRHGESAALPGCLVLDFATLLETDLISRTTDVRTSPRHEKGREFFAQHQIIAVLHAAAAYRSELVASLVLSNSVARIWTDQEADFATAVARIVAMIFAMHDNERTVDRLNRVSQGIVVLSGAGEIVYSNAAARLLPQPGANGLPFDLSPLTLAQDVREVSHDGRIFEIARERLPQDEILMRIDDVTARNAALAEAKRMEEQLKQSAKLQAMGQMASGVAHDFNNILGAITGFAQALHRKLQAAPEGASLVERIIGVCKKGQAMTREILDIACTASTEREPLDLSQLIGNDIHELQGANESGAVVVVLPPEDPLPVYGNAAQLTQLMQNLVVNATHACEGAEGRITVSGGRTSREDLRRLAASVNTSHERILGVVSEASAYCYLRVADNGHGIAPEVMDHMFEPFFTTKDRRKGSGLGLVVVHGVVDTHNGCCHVRSEAGKGTVFTIYLPLLAEAETVAA